MKKRMLPLALLAVLLAATAAGGAVLAQTSTHYNLEWHVIGSGAAPVSSASYQVNSTAGQGAASPPTSASTRYVVSAGYWFTTMHFEYLPVVLRAR
jgi:hypothetical protein